MFFLVGEFNLKTGGGRGEALCGVLLYAAFEVVQDFLHQQ